MKDIVLPTMIGVSSIAVGAVAIVIARQSHRLAEDVRSDEASRDAEAARVRYRDQLVRAVEATVAAVLAHRGTLWISRDLDGPEDRVVGGTTVTRFELLAAVADEADLPAVRSMNKAFIDANGTGDVRVVLAVLGELALALPRLLTEPSEVDDIVKRSDEWIPKAMGKVHASRRVVPPSE